MELSAVFKQHECFIEKKSYKGTDIPEMCQLENKSAVGVIVTLKVKRKL